MIRSDGRIVFFVLLGALLIAPPRVDAQARSAAAPVQSNPLLGSWTLNRARTIYGRGAEVRVRETFTCRAMPTADVECTIRSVRQGSGSTELVARFAARLDGVPRPVIGMPGMDSVRMVGVRGVPGAVDATFSARGTPVFAYRALRAADGRSLTIVAVDPVSRAVLTSVVVYDRIEGSSTNDVGRR